MRELKRVSRYQIFEVPLNYKFSIEKQLELELSVGHINIYSPALFRFLLRTEGFEIIKELCTVQTLRYYKDEEKVFGVRMKQKAANRAKWFLRYVLCLPIIRYLTDGMGYTAITVLTR